VPADVIISHHRCDRRARRLEHLVSRNSDNSSYPSSRDGQPGRPEPKPKKSRASGGGQRGRGGQPGAPLKCSVWDGTRSRVFGNARSSDGGVRTRNPAVQCRVQHRGRHNNGIDFNRCPHLCWSGHDSRRRRRTEKRGTGRPGRRSNPAGKAVPGTRRTGRSALYPSGAWCTRPVRRAAATGQTKDSSGLGLKFPSRQDRRDHRRTCRCRFVCGSAARFRPYLRMASSALRGPVAPPALGLIRGARPSTSVPAEPRLPARLPEHQNPRWSPAPTTPPTHLSVERGIVYPQKPWIRQRGRTLH
jgi:hypothetical protein